MTPAAVPPPRSPLHQRLRMRTGYHWRNSGNPVLTHARTVWDTRDRAGFPAVRSEAGGLSVSYAGLAEGLAYTLEFTELRRDADLHRTERRTGRLSGADLAVPGRLPDADIVMVGTSAARARALPRVSSLVVPMRVHFVIDFDPDDPDRARRLISKRERWQFRRDLREHTWTWGLDRDPAAFDRFYDRFYRPTMFQRHGSRERTESKEVSYECLFRGGRMFFLAEDGVRIGGALCHWDRASRTLTLRLLGVLDGAQEHYDSGAFKAVYHFLIDWCARHDVRRLDFQGTEPFLSKGTYQWKRRFGTTVILPPNHFGDKRLWFQVRHDTPQVRDFLVANPLLAERPDGALEAVYFHDDRRAPRLDYSARSPGVAAVREVDLDTFLAGAPRPSPGRALS
ncbi:peptidogalycan biosysnthesis protein [Streptomyces sp. WAC06614]|uniref:peptidogalycan biosysnthesis protein n=1 Tax=Streptomyces sp. WAC06614 TaxID=2487416 RepID=UPI000F7AC59C|nr:peptidogalycan biosysnthesis protein [Streptomyces sp. WAC06614]RSS82232.1 hypothetical protein EF918_07700 [Streptomyces sp. WAC06614]